MIKKLITMIKGIVKVARMVSSDDSGDFQQGDFIYMGRTVRGNILKQYGLLSRPPDGSMAVLLSQNAQESNVLALVDDPKRRPRQNLTSGEVVLTNYLAGQQLYLMQNGDAELTASRVIINVGSTTVTIADGQMTVENAGLHVDGPITSNDEITANASGASVGLTTHTTNGVTPGGGVSQSPTPGT